MPHHVLPIPHDPASLRIKRRHFRLVASPHAATKVLSEGGDLSEGLALTKAVRNTSFVGVGGTAVALDERGDRMFEVYEVMNYVAEVNDGIGIVAVGEYNNTLEQYLAHERAVIWPGDTMEVPKDFSSGTLELCL